MAARLIPASRLAEQGIRAVDGSNGIGPGTPQGVSKGSAARQGRPTHPPRKRGRWEHVFAALDLGTNNCRLLVAHPDANGFRVIDAFSRIVRLGEGIRLRESLSQRAMDRSIAALAICADKMKRCGVTRSRLIATEACRLADNGKEFLDRVEKEVGLKLDVISNAEEARLAVAGCASLIDRDCDRALVFDIGGGSTELMWVDLTRKKNRNRRDPWRPRILSWTSLPVGVVTLSEEFGNQAGNEKGYAAMVDRVGELIAPFHEECRNIDEIVNPSLHLMGTSGTVTTMAGIHLGLARYQRHKVDGLWMEDGDIASISHSIQRMSEADLRAQPCIGPERADLVLSGCAVLDAVRGYWPAPRLRVADRGLREGLLYSLMNKADRDGRLRRRGRRRSNRSGAPGPDTA